MIKHLLLTFLFISGCLPAFAQVQVTQDTLPNTTSADSTAVLNNNLRMQQNAINTVGGYFQSNGALAPSAGGTGQILAVHTIGNIYYDDGTNFFQNVGIGTSNTQKTYFLATNGSAAPTYNPVLPSQAGHSGNVLTTDGNSVVGNTSWVPGMTLVSTTTFSGVTNTGDIAITAGEFYYAKVVFTTTNPDVMWIRFNNDSTSNSYGYVTRVSNFSSATTANGNSNFLETKIITTITSPAASGDWMDLYLFPSAGTYCYGKIFGPSSGGSQISADFTGAWNAGTASSFRILTATASNMTGTVYLYRIART